MNQNIHFQKDIWGHVDLFHGILFPLLNGCNDDNIWRSQRYVLCIYHFIS